MVPRRLRERILWTGAVVVLVLLVGWLLRGPLERAFAALARPLASAGSAVRERWVRFRAEEGDLRERVKQLEEEREAWAMDRRDWQTLSEENAQLKDQLAYIERTRLKTVTASVIARSQGVERHLILLDRGAKDGVKEGSPVIAGRGTLVGKITEVRDHLSLVTAVSDPSLMTAVSLLNETRTIGVAQGRNGTLMTLKFIPRDQRVDVNDLVVTSGLEETIPSGLLVGVVNAVQSETTEPFQEAIVEPLVDLDQVRLVSILIGQSL